MRNLNEISDTLAPFQESRKRKIAKPDWFTKGVDNLSSEKNQDHKESLRTDENELLRKCEKLHKRVQSRIRFSKSEYFRREFENCVGDSKQTYRLLDFVRGVRKTSAQ